MINPKLPLRDIQFAIVPDGKHYVKDGDFNVIQYDYKVYSKHNPDDIEYRSEAVAREQRRAIIRLLPWSNVDIGLGKFEWDSESFNYVAKAWVQICSTY